MYEAGEGGFDALQARVSKILIIIRAIELELGQVVDKVAQHANFYHDELQNSAQFYRLLLYLPHT